METTLLDRVIEGASGDAPVQELLRQLKVLAARTDSAPLERWVDQELNGYGADDDVPDYRGPFAIRPLGQFVGSPAAGSMENVEIPPSTFPEKYRDGSLFHRVFEEPISTIEQWAQSDFTTFGWTADSVRLYNHFIRQGDIQPVVQKWFALVQVRYQVGQHTFSEIVSTVRTKILDLALDLERVAPLAGQREAPADQAAPATAVINNHFHAPASVAFGGDATQIVLDTPAPGDAAGLVRYLAAAGLPTAWLAELEEELHADLESNDPAAESPAKWRHTRAWFARAATDTTTGALGGAITAAAQAFLG